MKASRFSEAQKAFVLKQAEEGVPIGEVCRKVGISQATFYSWRKKYAGLLPTEMRRLKALEDENARLKKLSGGAQPRQGDAAGCRAAKNLRAARQRQLVGAVQVDWGVSQRRACATLDVNRSTCQSVHAGPDRPLWKPASRKSARPACATAIARVHVQLSREGWGVNHKKVHRVYTELGLQL